jgi:hypothetical protein
MFRFTKRRILSAVIVLFAATPATVHAAGVTATTARATSHPVAAVQSRAHWRAAHPGRDEVNARLAAQNARIDAKEHAGKITPAQAAALHRDDHQIRIDERQMAAQHNTHLTPPQYGQLNSAENQVSRKVGPNPPPPARIVPDGFLPEFSAPLLPE